MVARTLAYSLLKDTSNLRDGITALNALGLGNLTGDTEREASEKETLGILLGASSLAPLIYAIMPEEVRVEQPVSFSPTTNGITLPLRL